MMSTPNMSFDSPIVVSKSNFGGLGKAKDSAEPSLKQTGESSDAEATNDTAKFATKAEEEKKAKQSSKKDMFAPEADMFAEEYSVSWILFLLLYLTLESRDTLP